MISHHNHNSALNSFTSALTHSPLQDLAPGFLFGHKDPEQRRCRSSCLCHSDSIKSVYEVVPEPGDICVCFCFFTGFIQRSCSSAEASRSSFHIWGEWRIASMSWRCTHHIHHTVGNVLCLCWLCFQPYAVNGQITPQSNVDFDYSLRQRWDLLTASSVVDVQFITILLLTCYLFKCWRIILIQILKLLR